MAEVKIENTAEAWGAHLLALAAEAYSDAGEVGSELQLHHVLKDLTTVLEAYAGRLGVEKGAPRVYDPAAEQAAVEAMAATPDVASKLEADAPYFSSPGPRSDEGRNAIPAEPFKGRIETLEGAPVPILEIPSWILDTFQAHHERISALEAQLAAAQDVIEALGRNQQRDTIVIPEGLKGDDPLTSDDMRPEAWGSIERARAALAKRIQRKHAALTVIRQTVLNAVAGMVGSVDLSDDEKAELEQHRARADRLAQIDVVRDAKLNEVWSLDDLEAARAYDVDAGWSV